MIFHLRSLAVLGISSLILVGCAAELKTEVNLQPESPLIQVAQLPAAHARYGKRNSISSPAGSIKSAPSATQLFKRAGRRWTTGEEDRLVELREQGLPWSEIAKHYFPERSSIALSSKYSSLKRDSPATKLFKRQGQKWTAEEQVRLVELREQGLSWSELVESFPERSWKTLRSRYYMITKDPSGPKKRRGRFWTPEEDERLLQLAMMGKSWEEIAESLPGRTPSAVRGRYHSIPRQDPQAPTEKRERYTAEEDDILLKALEEGQSVEEASQLLERSTYSVHARLARLRRFNPALTSLKHPLYTVAELDLMNDLRERGLSWNQIQSEYFPTRKVSSLKRRYRRYKKERDSGATEE